jgi:hypothetical protein
LFDVDAVPFFAATGCDKGLRSAQRLMVAKLSHLLVSAGILHNGRDVANVQRLNSYRTNLTRLDDLLRTFLIQNNGCFGVTHFVSPVDLNVLLAVDTSTPARSPCHDVLDKLVT